MSPFQGPKAEFMSCPVALPPLLANIPSPFLSQQEAVTELDTIFYTSPGKSDSDPPWAQGDGFTAKVPSCLTTIIFKRLPSEGS
jgi:hypothetical protein